MTLRNFVALFVLVVLASVSAWADQPQVPPVMTARDLGLNQAVCRPASTDTILSILAKNGMDVGYFQYAMDHYYLFNGSSCVEGSTSWGAAWLSKYVSYLFFVRGYELWGQLSGLQKDQLLQIAKNEVREETFFVSASCGMYPWDSCSEDFISFVMTLSAAKNFFPQAFTAEELDSITALERKYFEWAFSTQIGWSGLTYEQAEWDNVPAVKMYNHDGESVVYSLLQDVHLNNALQAYRMTLHNIPDFYRDATTQANIRALFAWAQTKSLPDGSSFTNNCRTANRDEHGDVFFTVESCGDPNHADTIPLALPGGRVIRFFGTDPSSDGMYGFESFDPSYLHDDFRRLLYGNVLNPRVVLPPLVRRGGQRVESVELTTGKTLSLSVSQ